MKRILVATASEEASQWLAPQVIELARNLEAEVVALHVKGRFSSEPEADAAVDLFAIQGAESGLDVVTLLAQGDVEQQILSHAALPGVAMVVMGASMHLDPADWLSTRITAKCAVPVVVLAQTLITHDEDGRPVHTVNEVSVGRTDK